MAKGEQMEQKIATTNERVSLDEIILKGRGFNLIPDRFHKKLEERKKKVDINIYSITTLVLFVALTFGLITWRYFLKLQMLPLAQDVVNKMNELYSLSSIESKAERLETGLNTLETIELSSYDVVSFIGALSSSTDVTYELKSLDIDKDFKVTVMIDSIDNAVSLMDDIEKSQRFKQVHFVSLERNDGQAGKIFYYLTFNVQLV